MAGQGLTRCPAADPSDKQPQAESDEPGHGQDDEADLADVVEQKIEIEHTHEGTMTEYLLDRYPDGTYETFEYDDATGDITVRRWADVQPAIDANKQAHLDGDGKTGDFWLAASIPIEVANLWKQLYGIDALKAEHWPAVKKLLADPDWKHMRPTSFRL